MSRFTKILKELEGIPSEKVTKPVQVETPKVCKRGVHNWICSPKTGNFMCIECDVVLSNNLVYGEIKDWKKALSPQLDKLAAASTPTSTTASSAS